MESFESQTPVDNQRNLSKANSRPAPWFGCCCLLLAGDWAMAFADSGNEPPSSAAAQDYPPSCRDNSDYSRRGGETHYSMGQIEASEATTVRTQTDGLVQQVLVQSGDRVTLEQLLQSWMMRISSWQ